MERLDTKDYKRALRCLYEYEANKLLLKKIERDIEELSLSPLDGMPKAPYSTSDSTARKVIQKEENPILRRIKKEYLAVKLTLLLVDKISKGIYEEEFQTHRQRSSLRNLYESLSDRRKTKWIRRKLTESMSLHARQRCRN